MLLGIYAGMFSTQKQTGVRSDPLTNAGFAGGLHCESARFAEYEAELGVRLGDLGHRPLFPSLQETRCRQSRVASPAPVGRKWKARTWKFETTPLSRQLPGQLPGQPARVAGKPCPACPTALYGPPPRVQLLPWNLGQGRMFLRRTATGSPFRARVPSLRPCCSHSQQWASSTGCWAM